MLVLSWFAVCILFYIIQITLGSSGHALEVFAIASAIILFLISRIGGKIKWNVEKRFYINWNTSSGSYYYYWASNSFSKHLKSVGTPVPEPNY